MIPATVRLSNPNVDTHITNRLSGLSYRAVVPGGYASAQFSLQRPIDVNDPMLAPYTKLYIYDGRDGETLWEGELQIPGRSAGDQGQVWAMTGIGPSSHASDEISPLVYIDQRLEPWHRSSIEGALMPASANVSVANHPSESSKDGVICGFGPGIPTVSGTRAAAHYDVLVGTGMFIGAIGFVYDCGFGSSLWTVQLGMGNSDSHLDTPLSTGATSTAAAYTAWVITDFPHGEDFACIRLTNSTAGAVTPGDDIRWCHFSSVRVLGRRMDVDGVLVSGSVGMGGSSVYVRASWVVKDLLGRMLPKFDGLTANLAAIDTVDIDQLAYEDAVTPAQVLEDLMRFQASSYWAAWESNAAGLHRFEWLNWPTVPQFEASVADGFDSPSPTFEMYNQVNVRYRDWKGNSRVVTKTQFIDSMAAAGVVREGYIDLGDEAGSAGNANAVADTFLSEHASPYSAGTLTVARPIVDVINGRTVMPWQLPTQAPGKLIRVRGIEASHQLTGDATRDGITVFRIVSAEVNNDGVATLELDMFTQTEARALSVLLKKRNRRR